MHLYLLAPRARFNASSCSCRLRPIDVHPDLSAFVRSVFMELAPGTVIPYCSHALATMAFTPPKMVLEYVHSLQKDNRRRALAKQAACEARVKKLTQFVLCVSHACIWPVLYV